MRPQVHLWGLTTHTVGALVVCNTANCAKHVTTTRTRTTNLSLIVTKHGTRPLTTLTTRLSITCHLFGTSTTATRGLTNVSILLGFTKPFTHATPNLVRTYVTTNISCLSVATRVGICHLTRQLNTGTTSTNIVLLPNIN